VSARRALPGSPVAAPVIRTDQSFIHPSSSVGHPTWRRRRLLGLTAASVVVVSGCKGPLLPPDASAHGHLTDALLRDSTALGLGLGAIATVWLLLATFGLLPGRSSHAPADTARSRGAVLLLALSAFLVVDGHLLLGDLRVRAVLEKARATAAGDAVRIEVNAQRWSFLFRHPGSDGRFNTDDDVVTVNALRLPAGRAVELQLAASDVVHGLRIPALRIQTDAIPGRITRLFAVPMEQGVFPFQCSQHCGAAHYRMRGELEILEPARYDAWIAAESERARHRVDPADPHRNWGWEWRP